LLAAVAAVAVLVAVRFVLAKQTTSLLVVVAVAV
jgi:hypothetical protein